MLLVAGWTRARLPLRQPTALLGERCAFEPIRITRHVKLAVGLGSRAKIVLETALKGRIVQNLLSHRVFPRLIEMLTCHVVRLVRSKRSIVCN